MILVYETVVAQLMILALFISSYAVYERSNKWAERFIFAACAVGVGAVGIIGVTVAIMVFMEILI